MKFDEFAHRGLKHSLVNGTRGKVPMNETVDPDFALDERGERPVLSVTGDWVVATLASIDKWLG